MLTTKLSPAALLSLCVFCTASCVGGRSVTETEFLLGTTCSITLFGGGKNKAVQSAFTRVREIENLMSVTIPDSEVSRINRRAGMEAVEVSGETFELIVLALELGKESAGALDITVGPLVTEWGIGTADAKVPARARLQELLNLVDYRKVEIDKEKGAVFLPEQGMAVDLGAIAKGYAADAAAEMLRDRGAAGGIIDFGGNVLVFGEKTSGEPWKVGIQNPFAPRGTFFGILRLDEGAVVSSGTYERFFMKDDVRYHHLLDPGNGYPAEGGLESVAIVADSSTLADGYSTAAFVLGLQDGFGFISGRQGVEAIFVTPEKKVYVTDGLEDRFTLTDPEYQLTRFSEGPRQ